MVRLSNEGELQSLDFKRADILSEQGFDCKDPMSDCFGSQSDLGDLAGSQGQSSVSTGSVSPYVEKAESAVEACPSCMGNSGRVQMQKVKYIAGEGGDGFTEEPDLSVCRGLMKEAKAPLVLCVTMY